MTDKLTQIVEEEVKKLPAETQAAINALDWVKISEEIGNKYLISESEINDFQAETLVVLLGLQDFETYQRHIEDNVGTSKAEAEKIAAEALEKIFVPIANKIEENIKSALPAKNTTWDQNINFIHGGGDYSAFLDPVRDQPVQDQA